MTTTQLWNAKRCPKLIPNFVCPHITVEGTRDYLFEINPNDFWLKERLSKGKTLKGLLRDFGFLCPKFIAEVDKSIFLDDEGNWIPCPCNSCKTKDYSPSKKLFNLNRKPKGFDLN